MTYMYTCPVCDSNFDSDVKNGTVECPECNEELEVIDGDSAYIIDDEDFDDEDEMEEDGDDKDEDE